MQVANGQRLPAPATFDLKRQEAPYVFLVEKTGYQTEKLEWLTSSKQRNLKATLVPLFLDQEVSINSPVEGAQVEIDGKPAGKTPLTLNVRFLRDTKVSPWRPMKVKVSKPDYQSETVQLTAEKPAIQVPLERLRLERSFALSAKASDGSVLQATLTLDQNEVGQTPHNVAAVFTRPDKTAAWSTSELKVEVPTLYLPTLVTLQHDSPASFDLTLQPVTEIPVSRFAPQVEITATGAKLSVNTSTRLAMLDSSERGTEITGLSRLTRFTRRDQNPRAPLQALNSYTITPDGQNAILSITSQDDNGRYFSGMFLKRVEDEGGGIARLVDNNKRFLDSHPIIAPDSSGILVFQSNRGDLNKPDIFRINFADNRATGGVSRITNDQRFNFSPSYTDSNREVVYLSAEPNYPLAHPQLSNVKLDGALPTQFQIVAEEVSHREATKIYFTRIDESSGKLQIYAVEPDGRLETSVISDDSFVAANCTNPTASYSSPTRILFVSDRDQDEKGRNNNNIYVMNPDGSAVRQLTANGSDDILPSWSPTDPNVVYFLSNRGGAYNLWRLRLQ